MDLLEMSLESRKKALVKRFASLLHPEMSGPNKVFIRSNGYYHEVAINYNDQDCRFKSGQILVDQHGDLSLCVGIGRAPVAMEEQVTWFLFEQGEPTFIGSYVPPSIRRDFVAVAS